MREASTMRQRIFVAGATGVIGRRLIGLLVAQGHEVTAMTRRSAATAGLRAIGADAVVADAFDRQAVLDVVAAARPDVVMHQLTDLTGGMLDANAGLRTAGTRHLVDAALAAGARRVGAQSIAWAYAPGDAPADEHVGLDLAAPPPRRVTIEGVRALEDAVREVRSGSCCATACSTDPAPGTRPRAPARTTLVPG